MHFIYFSGKYALFNRVLCVIQQNRIPMPKRRAFIKQLAVASAAAVAWGFSEKEQDVVSDPERGKRVGIIGLDTSHSLAFAEMMNAEVPDPAFRGYRIVAAYPYGSRTIKRSYDRITGYMQQLKQQGVTITNSIDELLAKVDVVMLETNDGRLHREQALEVFKAHKPIFIDKPIAASYADTLAIFEDAKHHNVPVFSSSSLRYTKNVLRVNEGAIGHVIGAETYSPATIEPSHPDLFWYGIHGIEMLYAVMGTGCRQVSRIYSADTDIVVGSWQDGRIGTFRGIRRGKAAYGGCAFGQDGLSELGPYDGYGALLARIAEFFETGVSPVDASETLELVAFMEAAQLSGDQGNCPVELAAVMGNK